MRRRRRRRRMRRRRKRRRGRRKSRRRRRTRRRRRRRRRRRLCYYARSEKSTLTEGKRTEVRTRYGVFFRGPKTSHQPVTAKDWIQSQTSLQGFYDGQSGTFTGFSLSTSFFPCQYHPPLYYSHSFINDTT